MTECHLATQVISKRVGWYAAGKKVRTVCSLQDGLGQLLTAMLGVVEQQLHQQPHTREEVFQILEVTSEELEESPNVVAKDMDQLVQLCVEGGALWSHLTGPTVPSTHT